ncbi:MAG: hypothetical protein ACFFD4_22455, partial [Candidatus Odinarchaeota archaeon]
MEKSATTTRPDNFAMKFMENALKNYLSLNGFFQESFLQLGNFNKFKENVIDKSLKKCQYLREDPSGGLKTAFDQIIRELPVFLERMGNIILGDIVLFYKDKKELPSTDCGFTKYFSASRILSREEIEEKYVHYNKEKLRFGNFISDDGTADVLPAIVVLESNLDPEDIAIQTMNNIVKAFSSYNPAKQAVIVDCYRNLIDSYDKWLKKGSKNRKTKKKMADSYNKLKIEIQKVMTQLLSTKKSIPEELVEHADTLSNSKYEAKSFPLYPGYINIDHLQLLPPSGKQVNQYVIPVVGTGWNKDKNVLRALLGIHNMIGKMAKSPRFSSDLIGSLTRAFTSIEQFLKLFGINLQVVTISNIDLVYEMRSTVEAQEKLYQLILNQFKNTPGFLKFDTSFRHKVGKLSFSSKNHVSEGKHKILVMYNDWGKERKLPWKDQQYDILPELLFTLYLNAGLWPREIDVFFNQKDFILSHDDKWAIDDGFCRIIKAVFDGGILKLLLDGIIRFPATSEDFHNPFSGLSEKDHITIIPILNRPKRYLGRKSQIHHYYYDVLESLIAFNRIWNSETILYKRTFENRELLINVINDKITTELEKELVITRFNIQMFEKMQQITDMNRRLSVWDKLTVEQKDILWNTFIKHGKREFERVKAYNIEFIDKKIKGRIVNTVSFTTDTRKRILTENLFITSLMGLGSKTSEEDSLVKLLEEQLGNSDFEEQLEKYFELDTTRTAIQRFPGRLVQGSSVQSRMLTTANSLRSTAGISMNVDLEDHPDFSSLNFLVVNIEGKTLNQTSNYSDSTRLLRITVILYSMDSTPKVLFDDYFLKEPKKPSFYDRFFENLIVETCYMTGLPVIVRGKHTPKTGEWIQETISSMMTQNERSWKKIIEFTKLNKNEESTIKLWGFIRDFVSIPYLNLQAKNNDTRLLRLTVPAEFQSGDDEDPEKFNVLINMVLKGSSKLKASGSLTSADFYAHASALVSFINPESKLTEEEENKSLELLLYGATTGD